MTLDKQTDAKIRESFGRQSMMGSVGAELVMLGLGKVSIAAPVLDGYRQQQGFAHGGLIFTLGDSAAGYAALSVLPSDVEVMTAELKVNLLAPASRRLIAEGRVLKSGRRLIVVAADVWDEDNQGARKHVAALQGTMVPVKS